MAEGRSRSKKEVVMECHYNISVTPWFLIQPSLLWISNPAAGTTPETPASSGSKPS